MNDVIRVVTKEAAKILTGAGYVVTKGFSRTMVGGPPVGGNVFFVGFRTSKGASPALGCPITPEQVAELGLVIRKDKVVDVRHPSV